MARSFLPLPAGECGFESVGLYIDVSVNDTLHQYQLEMREFSPSERRWELYAGRR